MLRFAVFLAIFVLAVLSEAGPATIVDNHVQCAVCQFMGVATSLKTGISREKSIAHCLKFDGCAAQLTDCEIIGNLHSEFIKSPEKFSKSDEIFQKAAETCGNDPKSKILNEDLAGTQCMLCFLVYDVLKYINYNILENPMLATVEIAIDQACIILNEQLCQALLEPHTIYAIVRGLQDSLGGFYDLIGVQAFGCPSLDKLFGACPGH